MILILYPATLVNAFISYNCFLVECSEFSRYNIMSSAIKIVLSPFPIWIPFISCLIAVAMTSSTMWNKSSESGHHCLVLAHKKMFLLCLVEYDVGCKLVIYGFYYVEVCSFYSHFMESFYQIWCWILWNSSAFIDIIIWFLPFLLLMWYITLIWK